jgi:orotate phosphoribosyltransferase
MGWQLVGMGFELSPNREHRGCCAMTDPKPLSFTNQITLLARHAYKSCPTGVVLPTGERKAEYVDCLAALGRPALLASIGRSVLSIACGYQAIGGLEGAGSVMATAASLASLQRDPVSCFFVRRGRVSSESEMYLEGSLSGATTVALVAGFIRIADHIRRAIGLCQQNALPVSDVIALVTDADEDLQSRMPSGCRFTALSTLNELRSISEFTIRETQDDAG